MEFDLFVIGGGSGGVRAARLAAQLGKKVGLAEEYRFGGTCVIRGCVPKKLMVYASGFRHDFELARDFGWDVGEASFNWQRFKGLRQAEISRLEGIYKKNLEKAGVTLFAARAEFEDESHLRLSTGERIHAKTILIATGGTPYIPAVPGAEHAITSNEIFDIEEIPSRIAIIGGGYIASEFASIFNGFGSKVKQIYRGEQILRGFDSDLRHHVSNAMQEAGIEIELHKEVAEITATDRGKIVHLTTGEQFETDLVFYATGRVPATSGLGLEKIGVRCHGQGEIEVNAYSQTNIPHIYAIGDVTNRVNLTPVAIREGVAFVETVFKNNPTAMDYDCIPTAVFTLSEIGTVGLTEDEARANHDVEIYETNFKTMKSAFSQNGERVYMKLVVDRLSRRVLGCHIAGHAAAEMIQLVGIAVKMGATKEQFDATVAVHPTSAEELVTLRETRH